MTEKKFIIIISFVTLLILFGGVIIVGNSTSSSRINTSQDAKVSAKQTSFDWGNISYDGPKATKVFKIKNNGTGVLKLWNVKTSCTCTSAQVKTKQGNSPLFSMHSSSSWVGEIQPGEEGELEVVFDQQFHGPSGVGSLTRLISVETNDASRPKLEFTLTGNVIK